MVVLLSCITITLKIYIRNGKEHLFSIICVQSQLDRKWNDGRKMLVLHINIIDKSTAIFESLPSYRPNTDEETKIYRNMKISHCVNGMYYSPIVELDYTDEEFSDIIRKMPEYRQIDFKKELEQIKLDRIKEDF